MARKTAPRAVLPPDATCPCDHPRGWHKRGWGPCTFSETATVMGNDNLPYAVVERCQCRRFRA